MHSTVWMLKMKWHQKEECLCDGWKKKKNICTFSWVRVCVCVCVCVCVWVSVCVICGALRLLFLSHPTHLPVWRSVRASPVTFSGSWTPGPFSVTLCCHFWLVQPRQWCTRTVGGKMIYSPTSRSAWLKVVVFFFPHRSIKPPFAGTEYHSHCRDQNNKKRRVLSDVICTQDLRS